MTVGPKGHCARTVYVSVGADCACAALDIKRIAAVMEILKFEVNISAVLLGKLLGNRLTEISATVVVA